MSDSHRYNLPTDPHPESIPACESCVLGDGESYITPTNTVVMGLDQVLLPKDQRRGVHIVTVGLSSRRDIALDGNDGHPELYEGVVLPLACEALKGIKLDPASWSQIRSGGCPGPIEGRKKFLLFGPRKVGCGLLKLLQERSIPGA